MIDLQYQDLLKRMCNRNQQYSVVVHKFDHTSVKHFEI